MVGSVHIEPLAADIRAHAQGLPDSVINRMSLLGNQPALAWAALWHGLVFGLELQARAGPLTLETPISLNNKGEPGDVDGGSLVSPLPASVLDSLQLLVDSALPACKYQIPGMHRQVIEAYSYRVLCSRMD